MQHTEPFRPKLPSDPFDGVEDSRPWIIQRDDLGLLLSSKNSIRKVILIIGSPCERDLEPLLQASSLSNSLLLIITSSPPRIRETPSSSSPSVRILRLLSPLTLQDSGAQRLLSLFQRAEIIARGWRKHPEVYMGRTQLCENQPGGAFTIPETLGYSPYETKSAPRFTTIPGTRPASRSSLSDQLSSAFRSRINNRKHNSEPCAFDALINWVPSSFTDKAILKHIILVTTLSQTFLVPPSRSNRATQSFTSSRPPRPSSPLGGDTSFSQRSLTSSDLSSSQSNGNQINACSASAVPIVDVLEQSRRWSTLSESLRHPYTNTCTRSLSPSSLPGSPSGVSRCSSPVPSSSTPSDPTWPRAHIVHVLPMSVATSTNQGSPLASGSCTPDYAWLETPRQVKRKSKLLKSIEQFLISYTYPGRGDISNSSTLLTPLIRPGTPHSFSTSTSRSGSESGGSNVGSANGLGFRRRYHTDQRPAAYVISTSMLGYDVMSKYGDSSGPGATVLEMLLMGLLDYRPVIEPPSSEVPRISSTLLDIAIASEFGGPRVWIGHPDDIQLEDSDSTLIRDRLRAAVDSSVALTRGEERASSSGASEANSSSEQTSSTNRTSVGGGENNDIAPWAQTGGVSVEQMVGATAGREEPKTHSSKLKRMSSGWRFWKAVLVS
ncbi:hypothetical protein Moror_3189 [Moniliophthora roreri MCA 2997]|uniref:Uncharacterized protein n=2 Tax=Moniliophthora roreri TaxID=221103 RepID=V2YA18_MONRO|nr:hypothetical protein Moror_3189 [Moniliophthora roreri MCA 2997]KAI3614024.1 hypothetical protein WG66_010772 [Moniliophthora roreri]